jgi:hypothetical protein
MAVCSSTTAAAIGRRVALSRVLGALSVLHFAPQSAPALVPATPDVLKLASARAKAAELATTIPTLSADEGVMYVTQYAALNLKPAVGALGVEEMGYDVRGEQP